jgi:hypothetical protein
MQKSEEIFTEIVAMQSSKGITLGEAVVEYAEAADVEVEEVVKALDPAAVLQIKESLRDSLALKPSLRLLHAKPRLIF